MRNRMPPPTTRVCLDLKLQRILNFLAHSYCCRLLRNLHSLFSITRPNDHRSRSTLFITLLFIHVLRVFKFFLQTTKYGTSVFEDFNISTDRPNTSCKTSKTIFFIHIIFSYLLVPYH